jgi:hypothetical protein
VLVPVVCIMRGGSLVGVPVLSSSCGDGVLLFEGFVEDMVPASREDVICLLCREEKERKRQFVRW